jgi:Tol biopolymer transport system component
MRRSSALLALALGVAAVGFSSAPEAEKPTGRIVFLAYGTTGFVLWTMRADGTGARRVTRFHDVAEAEPEWSPDGRKIAFSRSDRCHTEPSYLCNRIWTVNADGSDAQRLIPRQLPGLLANRAVSFNAPTWSPDGRRIAYEQSIWESQRSNLYVMNADGSGRRRLTRLRNARSPAWSPDGAAIAFTHRPERPGNREIFVLTLKTGKLRRLTRTKADESLPQWSPDGRRIVYQRWDGDGMSDGDEVFVMNADGSGQRNLTRRPGLDGGPAWSPGGGLIAFLSGGEDPSIHIMPADGSGRARRVTVSSPHIATYELDWGSEAG